MSQVLQWTQFSWWITQLLAPGVLRLGDHLVDRRRAEALARIAVLLRARRAAQVGVGDDQMRRLVGLVLRAAVLHEVFLAEGELAVELELLLDALGLRQLREALHVRVARPASAAGPGCRVRRSASGSARSDRRRTCPARSTRRSFAPGSAPARPSSAGSAPRSRRASWRRSPAAPARRRASPPRASPTSSPCGSRRGSARCRSPPSRRPACAPSV